MRKNIVVDAGALTLFFAGDLRIKEHFNEMERGQAEGHICSVNLAEFYYKTCEKLGKQTADTWYHQSRAILRVVETDETLTHSVGLERCRQARRLSLADCHALALTRRLKAQLLTTDSELAKISNNEARYMEV